MVGLRVFFKVMEKSGGIYFSSWRPQKIILLLRGGEIVENSSVWLFIFIWLGKFYFIDKGKVGRKFKKWCLWLPCHLHKHQLIYLYYNTAAAIFSQGPKLYTRRHLSWSLFWLRAHEVWERKCWCIVSVRRLERTCSTWPLPTSRANIPGRLGSRWWCIWYLRYVHVIITHAWSEYI